MLRSEHVMARLYRGRLVPHRLSPEDRKVLEVAAEVVAVYESHLGRTRAELQSALAASEEEVGPRLDVRRGFRIVRALGKLLEESAEWATPTQTDPYTLRTRVFEVASSMPELPSLEPGLLGGPTRESVLAQVARETGLGDAASVERALYADRQGAQVMSEFSRPSGEVLISRYNLAQTQGVLYAAKELTVDLGARADARLVFHYAKRLALIHTVEPLARGGYRIHLDGPLSLFGPTRKYGLRLAKFLPGLLLTGPWRLSATVDWKDRDATLELDSERSGLTSHYTGPKRDEEQDEVRESFARAWERAKDTGGWNLSESSAVLHFPQKKSALVPDFTLKKAGQTVHLEILGFWSKRSLVERAALVREANRRGEKVLVAASENLGTSPEALKEAVRGGVVPFKGRLPVKGVLEALGGPPEVRSGP